MTTIAACTVSGLMVADSQWTDGVQCAEARKIYRVPGGLIGMAGHYGSMPAWRDLYARGGLAIGVEGVEEVEVIRLTAIGIETWTIGDGWTQILEPQWAIGSGSAFAIGAMKAGATPTQAVRIAITHDACSGGRPRAYKLTGRKNARTDIPY